MKQQLKRGLLALASVLLLSACVNTDKPAQESSTAEKTTDTPVEITFWHAMNGPQQEALSDLVKAFNQSQKTYHVKEQSQGDYDTLSQKVMAAGVSKELPTLAQATPSNIADWTHNNLLTPLDDWIKGKDGFTDKELDDIYPGFMDGVKYQGKLMGMPFAKSVRVFFVNTDILKEYNVDVPKTWEDVKAFGEKMKANGDSRYALGFESGVEMEVETMARQNGAAWIKSDLSTVDIASDKAIEPIQYIKQALDAGWARLPGEDDYMSTPFGRGEVATFASSSTGLAYIPPIAKDSGIHWTAVELPTFNEGDPLTLLAGNDLTVFKDASDDQKRGAVAFMHFLLQPENTVKWAVASGYLPVNHAGMNTETYQNYLKEHPEAKAATKEAEYAQAQTKYVGSGEYRDDWKKAQDQMLLEGKDIKTTMEQLEQNAKDIIKKNK
ncbi:MAG: ABC transporter substrate-binding protein [Aerococcus sp.]|nr:ABC transporter substrate-binding protein [Aerococcus sp.]